ncbi:YkgJ family cysteine cluster protein [Acidianus sulfidivorans JP7]|uniref:YkgJ family cysteine cluster protein n=1 Tax=Acidianus sulfidivorans JP7 TaxID=619593 RepID=A0A2U9ILS4_9CREN|nr:YkgJ family cysteine cluster protein [Acidianus sulfidivorans]AWR96963.1 YkgJ family cysteine cluster protein [Acidianus sulfidivorans JP7]
MISEEQVNKLTKEALRSNLDALDKIIGFLEKYENSPIAKFAIYSILFQFVFNSLDETGKLCEECGGKCCKSGYPIPVYNFDYNEMKKHIKLNLQKQGDIHLLSRPCPFQKGWMCTIHEFKPYACLSFPFATEDEQIEVIKSYDGKGIPNFHVPSYCSAGKMTIEYINRVLENLKTKLQRDPSPRELYEEIKKIFSNKNSSK